MDRPPRPTRLGTGEVVVNRAEVLAKVLAELIADHPMWDGIDYTMVRESNIADFVDEAAAALDAALAAQEGELDTTLGDHPHIDPGDGRTECYLCGKFVHDVIHSCKGVPVTRAAEGRVRALIDAVRRDAAQEGERGGAEVAAAVAAVSVLLHKRADNFPADAFALRFAADLIDRALADPAGALATHAAEVLPTAEPKPGDLVGALKIPAAARLRVGELIRVTGPGSWELEEDRPKGTGHER